MVSSPMPVILRTMGATRKVKFSLQSFFFRRFLIGAIASMSLFIAAWDRQDRIKDRYKAAYYDTENEFDFIIVGGGTAGGLLASRLSEEHDWKILVLEAGGEPNPLQCVPNFALELLNYKQLDWKHQTVSQDHACLGLKKRRAIMHGGKGLGGTSNLGFLLHERGNPSDYDQWAAITEDHSWSYDALVPFFARSEDFQEKQGEKGWGKGGPVKVESPKGKTAGLTNEWIKAGRELGYEGVSGEGFDKSYFTSKRGRRGSTFRSFIRKARNRPNLQIFKFSYAYKLLIGKDDQAYGVEYIRHGQKKVAFARKEIILSAGAIHTPKILMLSGIGPEMHLPAVGIPVRSALPVGHNLQDHVTTFLGPFFVQKGRTFLAERDLTIEAITEFTNGRGHLTTSGFQGTAILSSGWSYGQPDLHLSLLGISVSSRTADLFSQAFNLQNDLAHEFFGPAAKTGQDSFMIAVTAGRPESRGTLHLKDHNPKSRVIIDPKYLSEYMDILIMTEGIRMALQIVENSTSFNSLNAHLYTMPFPGCEKHPFRTTEYWECYVRHFTISQNHMVGTCSMGPADHYASVVDPELRVIGIAGLRVVDASVIPSIPMGGTQAATMMVAERASDIIKDTWLNTDLIQRDRELLFWSRMGPNRLGIAAKAAAENFTESEELEYEKLVNETFGPDSVTDLEVTTLDPTTADHIMEEIDELENELLKLKNENETMISFGDVEGAAETLDEIRAKAPERYHVSAQTPQNSTSLVQNSRDSKSNSNSNSGSNSSRGRSGSRGQGGRIQPANVPLINFNGSPRSPPRQSSRVQSIYDNLARRSDDEIIQPIAGHSLPKLYFHPENHPES